MTNHNDLLSVQPDLFEADLGTVIQAQDRFNAKRNTWLQEKINTEVDRVGKWFAEKWPTENLRVNVIFAESEEELEIRRTITYKSGHSFNSIISSDLIKPHTWNSPYLMDSYTKRFFDDQVRRISAVMEAKEKGTIN